MTEFDVMMIATCALPDPDAFPEMPPDRPALEENEQATVAFRVAMVRRSVTVHVAVPPKDPPDDKPTEKVLVRDVGLLAVNPGADHEYV